MVADAYKQYGTIDQVVKVTQLPRAKVKAIVDQIPNRESYRKRGTPQTYTRQELISGLQRARNVLGEPLSQSAYKKAARRLGLPAHHTVLRFFALEDPEFPWLAALEAAGIQGNMPRGKRQGSITEDECIEAVAQCIKEHGSGGRVSFGTYKKWASENGAPSGSTVRFMLGWNTVVELALERLSSVC